MMQSLAQLLTMGNNPQQIVQNIISQNPQLQVIMNQMAQSGMNPRQYAMQYAKQNNINIQPLVNNLMQKGIQL